MKPAKSAQGAEQGELYQRRLSTLLDQSHPLYVLAEAIKWEFFEQEFGALYVEQRGRPGLPMRLLVGLHYLKHLYDVSDERVVAGFVENPYWQYFCGEEFFVHELPCNPTSLVKWRQRIGPGGMEKLLQETIAAAQRQQALKPAELRRVNVDTTAQEKAIAFPTDARLYHKARCVLVREAQGVVPMPYNVSIKRIRKARPGFFRLAGTVNVAGSAPSGVGVLLFAGVRGKSGVNFKALASTKTRKGKYVFNRRLPKKVTYLFVERPPTSIACAVPLVTCSSSIVSNAISGVVRVAPPPKRR